MEDETRSNMLQVIAAKRARVKARAAETRLAQLQPAYPFADSLVHLRLATVVLPAFDGVENTET